MNKQKINAYLEESLKPWIDKTTVEPFPRLGSNANYDKYRNLVFNINNDIKNLIKDKSWLKQYADGY